MSVCSERKMYMIISGSVKGLDERVRIKLSLQCFFLYFIFQYFLEYKIGLVYILCLSFLETPLSLVSLSRIAVRTALGPGRLHLIPELGKPREMFQGPQFAFYLPLSYRAPGLFRGLVASPHSFISFSRIPKLVKLTSVSRALVFSSKSRGCSRALVVIIPQL
jgi:hypothetical protein